MAHYAYINADNIVTEVIAGPEETSKPEHFESWEEYFSTKGKGRCLGTSYNTYGGVHYTGERNENDEPIPSADQTKALRFNYAGVGYSYDETRDAFIPPTPYPSWVLDEATCQWEAPIAYPTDGASYTWDEQAGDWVVTPEGAVE